jgi:hemolysin activation/secretion protein
MRTVTALTLLTVPALSMAQGVGRQLNTQSPNSSSYQPLPQTAGQEYRLPPLPAQTAPGNALAGGQQVMVTEIRVEGITAVSAEEVSAVTAPYQGRMVTSGELQALRLALSRLYVDRGFVNSGVILPDQQVSGGVITYRAIEGRLTRIEFDERSRLSGRYVRSRVQQYLEGPLNVSDLQLALRNLQQDENIRRLDARLRPGDQLGQSVLSLNVNDAPRFRIGLGADNHRASSTGAESGTLLFGVRNLTGFGEELRASVGISEGADQGSVVFSLPVTARNGTFTAYYSRSDSDIVERRFRALDIQSETKTYGATLSLPLMLPGDNGFSVSLGLEAKDSQTRLLGIPFSFSAGADDGEAKTTVGLFGVDWLRRTLDSVTNVRFTYRRGLDLLDATIFEPRTDDERALNPTGADGEFDVFQGQGVYIRRLPPSRLLAANTQLVVRGTAQFALDPLLSLEKLAIGGANTVRGYPENLLVRDNGLAVTTELQIPLFGRTGPSPLAVGLAPFIDVGASWDDEDTDPGSKVRDSDDKRYIASVGLGVRWNPIPGLDAQVFWGADVADNFDGDDPRDLRERDLQDDGVHFSITYLARW